MIINELNGCEEDNLHYKIVQGNQIDKTDIIKIIFSDNLDKEENYRIFYPDYGTERLKIKVSGYFSKKEKSRDYEGCNGVFIFKITEIINVEDVTETESFRIDNK